MSDTWQHIRYEIPVDRVARITLARAETANAQDYRMLSELNEAFDRAARDESVRVIVLAADGKHFSSGHDLRAGTSMDDIEPIGTQCHFDAPGAEGYMATEAEMYVGLCWRWRNIPKPTIAQVQGKVIAGGLMLVWPMDLIVCAEDATFSDPVVAFGVNGHEYFTHPYEVGARLAKEMLFTGRAITAQEALQHGMVNKVVARDDLEAETLEHGDIEIRQRIVVFAVEGQVLPVPEAAAGQKNGQVAVVVGAAVHVRSHQHHRPVQ